MTTKNDNSISEVFFSKNCVSQMEEHVAEDKENERCGFLIGKVYKISGELCTYAARAIPTKEKSSSPVNVVIDGESQVDWLSALEEYRKSKSTNYVLVGWYHSHPFGGLCDGIFLSGRDMAIIESQLNQPYHVAVVLNPNGGSRGVFGWINGEIKRVKDSYMLREEFFK
ncbi:MAG: hypothetical protein CVT90_01690 [Candidatus Altiarchaeales archaeon HGW-Altiarchaeales-3]|nr:MAG: hypothetical protein CVT90_01690 [Candidatus Altiarchaeales archaeon HGW-Altiarchaeales-3]